MLGEIFYWVFNMSIAATVCMIPVLLIRLIKKIPRRLFIWLWSIPFIRMCIPVGISGKYGIMALLSKFTTRTVTVYESGGQSLTMMNHVMGADTYFPITYKVNILEDLFSVASVIWLAVALGAVIALFSVYFITLKELRDAKPLRDNVYLSDKIRSPAVYGVIKPRIVMPFEYKEKELRYILMHENAHIRRKDNLVRIAAFTVVCFHWFNPLAWLTLKLLYSDIELACDETVLLRCDGTQRKEYACALLSAAEEANVFAASFGGARIRLRIENILSYKRISVFSALAFALLAAAMVYVLLTNA